VCQALYKEVFVGEDCAKNWRIAFGEGGVFLLEDDFVVDTDRCPTSFRLGQEMRKFSQWMFIYVRQVFDESLLSLIQCHP
jgi:hypothetical protein